MQKYANRDSKDYIAGIQAMGMDGDTDITKDINEIRKALQLRGEISVDYCILSAFPKESAEICPLFSRTIQVHLYRTRSSEKKNIL